jgi:hypothetical protein
MFGRNRRRGKNATQTDRRCSMLNSEGRGRGWSRGKTIAVILAVAAVIAVVVLLAVSAGGSGGSGGIY